MAKQDYYDTLGIARSASDDDIKKAFRKKAMAYHPDKNPGDKKAEAKFKEINEAYDVLKDPQKRAAYDQMGHAAFEHGTGRGHPGGGFGGQGFSGNFEDIFEDFFGDIFGGGRGRHAAENNRGADLRYNLSLSLEDAYRGKSVDLKIPTQNTCDVCHGSGAKPGTTPATCQSCGGSGQIKISQGFFSMSRTCPTCHGQGQVIQDKCKNCSGSGRVKTEKNINVTIPKGVDDGTRIRLSGKGEAGLHGGPAGDLYIFIQLEKHPLFQRDQRTLHLEVPLPMTTATLGGEIDVPTPDGGKARLKIPEGTQPGQVFRLKGKGMPVVNQRTVGDMMVTVQVEVPTKLSKKQRAQLEEFQAELSEKNTPVAESFSKKIKAFWKKF
jgi:molecular chaperone DnaJ